MASRKSTRTRAKAAKPDKAARTPKAAATADVIEEVDEGGMGIDDGIVLTTTLLLLGAVVLVYLARQSYAV